ncbi:beta-ketoacyl synthase N-terminal-like domain-containing protein [Photorhabdus asymbiotica]|uniref:beta-ketoacyl synthase N-terminal-like domain-containing protein n=1 Tax=Photorhabdus asymbiotica TaxID=291112 RepID=UPI003DA70CED
MSETYSISMYGKKGQGDIAIIGMASHFPDASNLHEFWENIMAKRDSLTDITTVSEIEYWSKEDFYHPDASVADKTYSHKAGFVPAIDFDPVEFKIPPTIIDSISTIQLFSLYVAKQAMLDAGLIGQKNKCVNRDRIGVILGGSGNGNTLFSLSARQQTPYLRKIMIKSGLPEEVVDEVIDRVHDSCLEWNEDSLPGFLGNVACGRIASHFDLGGTTYMVDAACASSLAAIKAAIGELNSGSCDVVLTGGVNLENSAFSFICFSKTPALSKSNLSRPFDRDSDGIMLGDGVGMLVLKRLKDAELDGDKIYAVIKSIEASSDGKAKSIFAPRYEGQVKALKRAYASAGLTPADIQLIEAHGTGTATGDNTELKSLRMVFDEYNIAAKSVAIGSIKSQIGHTRSAAGAASMIKTTLALYHKVLPPTINVSQPDEMLSGDNGPFYINNEPRPWLRPLNGAPRRAALSAFGFGGTNFHAILEEYQPEQRGAYRLNGQAVTLLFCGETPKQLLVRCEAALARFGSASSAGQVLREHLAHQDLNGLQPHQARLLFVATSGAQAAELMTVAVEQLKQRGESGWEHPLGIYYQPSAKNLDGKVVALFPGQGSQYVNMGRDIANDYPEMRQALEALDAIAVNERGQRVSHVIYPTPVFSDAERQQQNAILTDTANAQPALGAISAGYFAILKESGFNPDFVAGHSYGEVTALWAAGVLSDADFYRVSLARGMAAASAVDDRGADADAGAMLAASLTLEQRENILELYPEITVANDNSASQVVLAGATTLIHQLHNELKARQIHCRLLPVSAAFHTEFIQSAYAPFREYLEQISFRSPQRLLFSSATAAPYSQSPADIASLLAEQLVMPVRFREMIETIYQRGGRLFVEIGPKGVLSKLVADILNGREHSIISVNTSDKGEERLQLARAQARLLAEGVRLNVLDRYARVQPPSEEKTNHLTFRLSGGFFMSDKNQARRERAMRDGDTAMVERFMTNRAPVVAAPVISKPPPAPVIQTGSPKGPAPLLQRSTSVEIQKRDNPMEQNNQLNENMGDSNLEGLLQAQRVMSQLHEQFQTNQKEYIQLLGSLLNKQYTLLEKFQDHQNLPTMLSCLGQSVQLLEKNLELYHSNHERYFATQQSLFQSGQAVQPVAAVVTPKVTPVVEPAPIMKEIVEPRPAMFVTPSAPVVNQPVTLAKPSIGDPELELKIKRLEQITEAKIIGKLVAIISDKTGYPQDMIDAEMDLEADLGIDSIKRLEIFGAMFDTFSADTGIYHDVLKNKYLEAFDIEVLSNIRKISMFFKQMNDEIIADIRRKNSGDVPIEEAAASKDSLIGDNAREQGNGQTQHSLQVSEGGRAEAPLRTLGFVTSTSSVPKADSAKKSWLNRN